MLRKVKQLFSTPVTANEPQKVDLGRVTADGTRCVQCGICGYNCPVGIPVRDYARQGLPVTDASCITCGQCINVCPRGTLRWEKATLLAAPTAETNERLTPGGQHLISYG
ncbi:MAG: 4Fe-4S dicluster domain-containing protein [Chloroflexota bacterium]